MRHRQALVFICAGLAFAACSDDAADSDVADSSASDVAGADTSTTDSAPPDVAAATIDIHVKAVDFSGLATKDARVALQDRDGTLVGIAHTDAAGEATVTLPEGGMLTSFGRSDNAIGAYTVMDLADGDTVTVMAGDMPGGLAHLANPNASVAVNLPGAFAGAAKYQVSLACGRGDASSAAAPVTVDYDDVCYAGATTANAFGWALDAAGTGIALAWADDLPLSGAPGTLGAWVPATSFATYTLTMSDAPAGADPHLASLGSRRHELRLSPPSGLPSVVPHFDAGGTMQLAERYAPDFIESLEVHVAVSLPQVAQDLLQGLTYTRSDPTPPAGNAVSLEPSALGLRDDVAWDFDPITHIGWTGASSDAAQPDAQVAYIVWALPLASGNIRASWTIVMAPDHAPPVSLPEVPLIESDLLPPSDAKRIGVRLSTVSSEEVDGYGAYLATYGSRIDQPIVHDGVVRAEVTRSYPP